MGNHVQLQIAVQREADRVVVRLEGELDLSNAPLLQSAIDDAELDATAMVVLDLEELQFIDSTGLRIVLELRERSLARGQDFAVTPGSQQVQRLLSVTGVAEHLQTIDAPGAPAV
jgi:anti-sigma B factor antagonist